MHSIPVTVLTGFLGAGKTTLLNRVLSENHGRRFAVIVNEFGEIGIDNELVVSSDEEIYLMNNGCICCSVRGDLIRVLGGLIKRRGAFDGILLETTGLADPAAIIQTFAMDEDTRDAAHLDTVTTVIDAVHFARHVAENRQALEQVVYADLVICNKTDLVTPEVLEDIKATVRRVNDTTEIVSAVRCDVPLTKLLDRKAFDIGRLLFAAPGLAGPSGHAHEHDHGIQSVSLTQATPLDPERLGTFLADLLREHGQTIYRCKGIMDVAGSKQRFIFQGVHMYLETSWGAPWKDDEERRSRAVFIGRELDRNMLEKGLAGCAAKEERS
jgi:G3E family GTPase